MAKEYDLKTAAELVSRDPSYLRHEIAAKRLPARKLGGSWIVSRADLKAWYAAIDKRHKLAPVPLETGGD
jgi:excisionase family DNA binding protein